MCREPLSIMLWMLSDCTFREELWGQEIDIRHRLLFSLLETALSWFFLIFFFLVHKFSICLTLISVKGDFLITSKYLVTSKEAERWWSKCLSPEGPVEFCCEIIDWLKPGQSTGRDWLEYVLSLRVNFSSSSIFHLPRLDAAVTSGETWTKT